MPVGITGFIGAGKDELSSIIIDSYGYEKLSFGQEVREECKTRGMGESRDELQSLGNLLRTEIDGGIWARRLISRIVNGKDYIINGIRNKEDVDELIKLDDFYLIGIDAPYDLRCQRVLKRGREGDPKTPEEFEVADLRDRGVIEGYQNTDYCYEQADYCIYNNQGIDYLQKRVREVMLAITCGIRP